MQETDRLKASRNAAFSGIPGKRRDSLQSAFEAFRKRKYLVLTAFLIIALVLCGVQYLMNTCSTASTVLSLDYEEASKGLAPNGTRFSIYEIRSSEVMGRLIGYAGLEGKITPEELSECISVKATHDKTVSVSENYISTSFVIKFTGKGAVRDRSAEDMLSLLCKTYREYFVEHYGFNHSILSRAKNLCTYDIAKARSYIIENGIVNDRFSLNTMLNYKIRMDRLMYDKMIAAYDEDNEGIRLYDTAMSAIVMIPTQDQTMQYYMSRTKTGMDNMALHANMQLTGATERLERIEYNTYLTEKLKTSGSDSVQKEKADAMLDEIQTSLEKLAADIQTVDSSYTSTKARNYLSFSDDGTGFAERSGLIGSLLLAALILAAAFICEFLRTFFSKKKEKEA